MDALISFGKGYSIYGAIISTIAGIIIIWVGNRVPDNGNPDTAKYATITGAAVIVVGIAMAYLAQNYNVFAEIYGVFFVLMILSIVIGMIKK